MIKKRALPIALSIALIFSILTVTSAAVQPEEPDSPQEAINYQALYASTLEQYYRFFVSREIDEDYTEDDLGIWEAVNFQDSDSLLESIGYALQDLNGDSIPELLIGYMPVEAEGITYSSTILNVHTLKDDQPLFVFGGWARNAYFLLPDGSFFCQGSAGAAYSILGVYRLTQDGTALSCMDYYFTHEVDGNFENIGVYHNTDGEFDITVSEKTDMSLEDFYDLGEVLHSQTVPMELTSFAEAFGFPSTVSAEWDDTEAREEAHVLFSPINGGVKDFRLLSLQIEAVDEYGQVTYEITEERTFGDLEMNYPITVSMIFAGDTPGNGVSFVDTAGVQRRYTVSISGEDGSLVLCPF